MVTLGQGASMEWISLELTMTKSTALRGILVLLIKNSSSPSRTRKISTERCQCLARLGRKRRNHPLSHSLRLCPHICPSQNRTMPPPLKKKKKPYIFGGREIYRKIRWNLAFKIPPYALGASFLTAPFSG